MSSSICPHFTQNAWKKDLCSNCFKSKDEHKAAAAAAASKAAAAGNSITSKLLHGSNTSSQKSNKSKTDYPNKHKTPTKSIIKKALGVRLNSNSKLTNNSSKATSKVSFQKQLHEIIGYGGEWSDNDTDDDDDDNDDHDFMNLGNEHDDMAVTETDDEETVELKRITRANTDFNMNNGNLLGDAQDNIKKSFAALKLGAPQMDKEGKKQTLKINVVPFGGTGTETAAIGTTTVKAKFETKSELTSATTTTTTTPAATSASARSQTSTISSTAASKVIKKVTTTLTPTLAMPTNMTATKSTTRNTSSLKTNTERDGKDSPPIERAMEKSLLDEISETLEQKKNESKKLEAEQKSSTATANSASTSKIKFELTTLSESLENKPFLDLKKPIARNAPITKDHAKPKVNVCHKFSDSDSNCSDNENGVSAYYDVVETQISYENLPDGKYTGEGAAGKEQKIAKAAEQSVSKTTEENKQAMYSSSQYITDMLLSSKTRAASYNLHEGNFMTSKITSDGLIVTKCSSDDALDSTGSSFDGSSDEETTYNMIRSESDSGIGISIGNEYKNIKVSDKERLRVEKKLSASTNNSDYEDIQIVDQAMVPAKPTKTTPVEAEPSAKERVGTNRKVAPFILDKSRELHGEPDGSADPDNSLENKQTSSGVGAVSSIQQQQLPALPKSPPPLKIDARPSFLHGVAKQPPIMLKKPDLPIKPLVSPVSTPLKTFMATTSASLSLSLSKRTPNSAEQQLINQLQTTISKSIENLAAAESAKDDAKLKKGRAPNPPPEPKSSAPPTPERDYSLIVEFEAATQKSKETLAVESTASTTTETTLAKATTTTTTTAEMPKTPTMSSNDVIPIAERTEAIETTNAATPVTSSNAAAAAATANNNIYTRKPPSGAGVINNSSVAAAPVIREKDKRERATINPKFRSLNTFVTQRTNAAKNLQLQTASSVLNLKQPMTPEPTPRNHKNFSMSEECLTAANDKKTPPKTKAKFSIKKFLRMGSSSGSNSTKNGENNLHKRDSVYTEICTGEDAGVAGKPRLVIIHPIDINPTAVEVVKDITKTSDPVTAQTVAVVTSTPPAPPLRQTEGQRLHEVSKPARPPPPKSAELRRKQKIELTATLSASSVDSAISGGIAGGSLKCKADNVYANLGEIRSSIAPRKPERTASMREREAQLELARKRHHISGGSGGGVVGDTISICSSNGEHVSNHGAGTAAEQHAKSNEGSAVVDGKPPLSGGGSGSRTSTFERNKKNEPKTVISSKMEIFEQRFNSNNNNQTLVDNARPSSLKDSVRKINSTIDSYLKDKRDYENMYEMVKTAATPPPPPARNLETASMTSGVPRLLPAVRRNNLYSDTASIASYTRSEYGPVRGNYGLHNSLANIPRMISASYAGSEVGEFDIYAPYSYYGSEAGGDVATDINDSVWGLPSAAKNRIKATNRLRMRKGRSVVHKNIEDNYTAVVVANHEALAQVLDQLQQTPVVPAALRPLANAINLRFEDFTILEGAQAFVVGKKAFHAALWTNAPVTLALSADCNQLAGAGGELSQLSGGVSDVLNPITEFCDLVPSYQLPLMPSTEVTLLQATISVLPRLQLETLQSIGTILKGKSHVLDKSNFNFRGSIPNLSGSSGKDNATIHSSALRNVVSVQNLSTLNEESTNSHERLVGNDDTVSTNTMPAFDDVMTREVAFIMLQLVNGMKNLQAKAIEEMPLSLSNVVLSKDMDNKDAQARLCVLQGNNNDEDEPMDTLCKCAYTALVDMLPSTKITAILADILQQERAESLSKAKSVLEFALWGPSDVVLSGSTKERELALQRWLDLERATVLHGLVRTRVELTVYDECHLMFLVRSTAKMMNDAAKIVCSYQQTTPSGAKE